MSSFSGEIATYYNCEVEAAAIMLAFALLYSLFCNHIQSHPSVLFTFPTAALRESPQLSGSRKQEIRAQTLAKVRVLKKKLC